MPKIGKHLTFRRFKMTNLLVGFILGIVVSTVGFSGIAKMADRSIDKVKEVTIEQTK
jgi:hypothetical protein